ncbi:aromatic acid exporter family protein [Paenibacillus sp. FSL W7-1279]|uniref:aromatic acid exporter family protein n=1 Tax=Paenibacillus TaxID=44249 RepID=UPI00188CF881|nr:MULTISPECIES: aromatic acid exporter family protein [Paenibacillus]MBU5345628.1 aromatic acid exporter family protein [Paenibacillus lautus]MBX4149361.1 aromatic acid exporter family protein [Paenibacillus lautus]MCT1402813.1 aromatic acid exporter family protein [Paenibacillus sp. p3-SID867]
MGFRVIKTAAASLLAILITDALNIPGATSAGLLAILGVDVTRKRSVRSISSRLFASLLGLVLACILFYFLGFHYWVLALYILLAFPAISKANFKEGIVTSSVVVFRVFQGEEIGMDILLTQIELLIIGLGSAMLVNLVYMPNSEGAMMEIRQKVDGLFSVIFRHFSLTLRDPEHIWDGKELIEANRQIEKGIEEAKRASENQMIHPDGSWNIYFYMRKEQMENIQSMMHQISQVYERLPHGVLTAEIFDQLSKDVVAEGYTGKSEGLLIELEDRFKEMELPTTREEFEVRSAILQLCHELEYYLNISKKYKAPTAKKPQKRADSAV